MHDAKEARRVAYEIRLNRNNMSEGFIEALNAIESASLKGDTHVELEDCHLTYRDIDTLREFLGYGVHIGEYDGEIYTKVAIAW